jgi:polar amino acid transport system permease protein
MEWDWAFVWQIMPTLLEGLKITILATILGAMVAAVVGLVLAIARRSPNPLCRARSASADFIRGTPLLVQLYFIFYVLPDIGIRLSPLVAGVIGLGHPLRHLCGGSLSRRHRQRAARTVGGGARPPISRIRQAWIHVILPQAIPPMIPALANYFIAMFKETPLLSAITVLELMNQAKSVANSSYRYIEPITLVGVFFLVISLISVVRCAGWKNATPGWMNDDDQND